MSIEFVVEGTPVLIANPSDQFVATSSSRELVKFVAKSTDTPPNEGAVGHVLLMGLGGEVLTRASGISGYVFAVALNGVAVPLVVSGSTVT
jgi:hypothetical protein